MQMPRGLMIILLLLSLGFCWDIAVICQGGAAIYIMVLLLAGRIAAIVGILMRTRTGWWLAMGFFGVIVALNAVALAGAGGSSAGMVRALIPLGCLVYLFVLRAEFD